MNEKGGISGKREKGNERTNLENGPQEKGSSTRYFHLCGMRTEEACGRGGRFGEKQWGRGFGSRGKREWVSLSIIRQRRQKGGRTTVKKGKVFP